MRQFFLFFFWFLAFSTPKQQWAFENEKDIASGKSTALNGVRVDVYSGWALFKNSTNNIFL